MDEHINARAEARRRRLLKNSESRLKALLGDGAENMQNYSLEVNAPTISTEDVVSDLPIIKHAQRLSEERIQESPLSVETENNQESKKTTVTPEVNSSNVNKTQSKWLILCIVLAAGSAIYLCWYSSASATFFSGFVVFMTVYVLNVLVWSQSSDVTKPFFITILTILLNHLDLADNTKHALKTTINVFIILGNYFCVYSFVFFGVYKILN